MRPGTDPTVNVGLDGTEVADRALEWALTEARLHAAPLRLLHGLRTPVVALDDSGAVLGALRAHGDEIVHRAADVAASQAPEVNVLVQVSTESPTALLREASVGARLTVVGTRGRSMITDALFGSVAMRVVAHARGPVLIVRQEHDRPAEVSRILLALDGSAGSERAAEFAFEEAARRGVGVVAVRTWDDVPVFAALNTIPLPLDHEGVDASEAADLAAQVAPWSERYPDVPVEQRVLRGRTAVALLEVISDEYAGNPPGMVVVGSRGRNELTGLLLGSTSQALVANATWPTVVVGPR